MVALQTIQEIVGLAWDEARLEAWTWLWQMADAERMRRWTPTHRDLVLEGWRLIERKVKMTKSDMNNTNRAAPLTVQNQGYAVAAQNMQIVNTSYLTQNSDAKRTAAGSQQFGSGRQNVSGPGAAPEPEREGSQQNAQQFPALQVTGGSAQGSENGEGFGGFGRSNSGFGQSQQTL